MVFLLELGPKKKNCSRIQRVQDQQDEAQVFLICQIASIANTSIIITDITSTTI